MPPVPITSVAELAASVRDARTSAGITQEELAAKIGVSRPWISQFERGCTPNAGIDRILAMINVLGIRLSVEGPTASAPSPAPPDTPSTTTRPSPETSRGAWRNFSVPAPVLGGVSAAVADAAVADAIAAATPKLPKMDLSHLSPDVSSFFSDLFATENAKLSEELRTGVRRRSDEGNT